MSDSMKAIFEEQERDRIARAKAALLNAIRGAIVEIEEGEYDDAILTLKQIIGDA